ncbi:MAG: DUF4384 domain-containing protein [Acidobacteria bacterium]|nr:DUF4384 domain-containing protein [Acidobacteriota bacterium]
MHKHKYLAKLSYSFIAAALVVFMLCGAMFGQKSIKPPTAAATAAAQAVEPEDEGRQIYFEYAGSRPKKPATAKPKSAPCYVRKTAKAKIGAGLKTAAEKSNVLAQVGVTLWQLRPSTATDDKETRIIIQEEVADESKASPLTPVRIEADKAFVSGDKVRLSIESPRSGYLYVIDRELYADGTQSAPFLIFPTLRTRGGNNSVQAGMLIDIPAQEDRPNFFTMKPSRSAQVAEVLTIIVSPQPLDVPALQRSYLRLPEEQVAKWERDWKTDAERFEMEGGAGQVWTRKEKQAGAGNDGALLDQDDPAPQTIYRVNTRPDSPLMITVPLRYQN